MDRRQYQLGRASACRSPLTAVAWAYIGWYLLLYISVITIIGWAWVITAWMRWICRNIAGTRREIVFNGSGLAGVVADACSSLWPARLIIPIPWVMGWYTRWYVSQFALVERTAYANA